MNYFHPNSTLTPLKNFSIKDALDCIPKYDGNNIPLSTFLFVIREAMSMIPPANEAFKTHQALMGELAVARQRTSESVIMFANRIKRIAIELKEAAKRDKADDNGFAQKVEKDKLKFFLRGVDWEIKRRMGEPTAFQQAVEKAIEIEREVIDLEKSEPDRRTKTYQENYKLKSQVSEVNIVQTKPLEICQFCGRKNHVA